MAGNIEAERLKAKNRLNEQQQVVYEQYPENNYTTYLMNQAEQGNDDALKSLRNTKKNDYLIEKMAINGDESQQGEQIMTALSPKVRKSGNVVYTLNDTTITDTGKAFKTDQTDKASIAALLRLARQKYGDSLTVQGDEKFQQQAVEVAVAEGMKVTFKDPLLERKRQVLEAATTDPAWRKRNKEKPPAKSQPDKKKNRGQSR